MKENLLAQLKNTATQGDLTVLLVAIAKAFDDTKLELDQKIREVKKLQGPKGDKGDKGDPGRNGNDGIGLPGRDGKDGKDGRDGRDGYTPIKGKDYFDGKDGKDANPAEIINEVTARLESELPKFGTAFRDGLELLQGDERLDKSAIKGLEEELKKLYESIAKPASGTIGGGVIGRDLVKDIDLSDQLDGVTATFNIPAIYNIVSVALSSFPTVLRKNIDYTFTNKTITFTSQIDPASSLAAGQTCVLTVVSG